MKLLNDYEKLQNENKIITPLLANCKSNNNGSAINIMKEHRYGFRVLRPIDDINTEFTLARVEGNGAIRNSLQGIANSIFASLGIEPCEVVLYKEPNNINDIYSGSYSHREGFIYYNLGNFSYNEDCGKHVGASVYANLIKLCVDRARFIELAEYINNSKNYNAYEKAVNSYFIASKSIEAFKKLNNIKEDVSQINFNKFDSFYRVMDVLSRTNDDMLNAQLRPIMKEELSEIAKANTRRLASQLIADYKSNMEEFGCYFDGVVSNKVKNSIDLKENSNDLLYLQNALEVKINRLKDIYAEKDNLQDRGL